MNIHAELLSGTGCTFEVAPENTIQELKEIVKKASCQTFMLFFLLL